MAITAQQVAELRERTGAGMMDAKKALVDAGGDMDKAIEELLKKGMAKAAKKADRVTSEGLVFAYIHGSGKLGAMVEVNCETDFVARNEAFQELVRDLAMHVSATDPLYVKREDVPDEVVEKQISLFKEEAAESGKPADVIEKIVEGKMNKWYEEVVLLEQPFIKDEDMTINDLVTKKIASLGENIQVHRFSRFQIG